MSNLPLICNQAMRIDFCNNLILWRSFPYPLSSGFWNANHKTTRDIMLTSYFLILLHQRNVQFCIFIDFYSELWVIKPSVITLKLNVIRQFRLFWFCIKQEVFMLKCMCLMGLKMCFLSNYSKSFIFNHLIKVCWTSTSVSFTSPFTLNWVNFPILRKNFVYNNLIKLKHKVIKAHPPRAVRFFCFRCVFNILFNSFELLPVIRFLTKWACPYSFASPRIS